MAGSQDKTESATPERRREARKKGQVARSVELSQVFVFLAAFYVIQWSGPGMLDRITNLMRDDFTHLKLADFTATGIHQRGLEWSLIAVQIMAPILLAALVIGLVVNMGQVGFIWSTEAAKPQFNRINPMSGFKRIFSQRSLVEFIKSLMKTGVIGYVVYSVMSSKLPLLGLLHGTDVTTAGGIISSSISEMGTKVGFVLFGLAAADYGYQRWAFEKDIRMSTQDIKEEMKRSEGDPMIRAALARRRRALASKRMMQNVPNADVVVTNPTHFAVAIEYKPDTMQSPRVVAKGQGLVAQRIKEIAREHSVPVVENKPLAQALFKMVEVDMEIPGILYRAVAEVLAFIYTLKKRGSYGQ